MRYRSSTDGRTMEVVDLGNGVTYEIPVKQPERFDEVTYIRDMGNGVTYEVTERIARTRRRTYAY